MMQRDTDACPVVETPTTQDAHGGDVREALKSRMGLRVLALNRRAISVTSTGDQVAQRGFVCGLWKGDLDDFLCRIHRVSHGFRTHMVLASQGDKCHCTAPSDLVDFSFVRVNGACVPGIDRSVLQAHMQRAHVSAFRAEPDEVSFLVMENTWPTVAYSGDGCEIYRALGRALGERQ